MRAATFPLDYAPPRFVNGVLRTCRLVEIGLLHRAQPSTTPDTDIGTDAEQLQAALLERAAMHPAERLVLRGSAICGVFVSALLICERLGLL